MGAVGKWIVYGGTVVLNAQKGSIMADRQLPLILALTGASGVIYGVRALEVLHELKVPVHLIISDAAALNLEIETDYRLSQIKALATRVYDITDMAAAVASGSFRTCGMLISPCTIKTLSAVANAFNDNLIVRAADVCLKERRRLVLMVRETPFHAGHIELMTRVTALGGIILPPIPAFYHQPKTIADIIDQSIGKALDLLGVEHQLFKRWSGR
ncbi:flavin prenyltransferase UbiX [Desulfosarcina ovata subsp. ovata]|uniref:Flavin prenyltransferase UbiX n=2 Tax=Desulfosarcina ovata TaxID=83564 RepID=A0A5K8AHE5_9BACT|nr:flavin prenyltransferase UbiX [Desulfosarcina ovata subsp. ovata]